MGRFKKEEVAEDSDWNMGVDFYQQLAFLKEQYIYFERTKDLSQSISSLNHEIDWVNVDFGREKLQDFRKRIDSINNQSQNNLSKMRKHNLFVQLNQLKREVWDLENSLNITRPKNNVDMSNTPVAFISNR